MSERRNNRALSQLPSFLRNTDFAVARFRAINLSERFQSIRGFAIYNCRKRFSPFCDSPGTTSTGTSNAPVKSLANHPGSDVKCEFPHTWLFGVIKPLSMPNPPVQIWGYVYKSCLCRRMSPSSQPNCFVQHKNPGPSPWASLWVSNPLPASYPPSSS